MYAWRKWTPKMRDEMLAYRQQQHRPWHGPPHFSGQQTDQYLITGTCFEHKPLLGSSPDRLNAFSSWLHQSFHEERADIHAWCLLPNHYHVLATIQDLKPLVPRLGRLHGSTSRLWNLEDHTPGRQCWHRATDRAMRSEAHFWATVNYIHHNPVKHGYVNQWTEWPWSSAHDYLRDMGRDEAARIWKGYALGDYGLGWDDQ